jgi:hypothetical protein
MAMAAGIYPVWITTAKNTRISSDPYHDSTTDILPPDDSPTKKDAAYLHLPYEVKYSAS